MESGDVIVRLSGQDDETRVAFSEIEEIARKLVIDTHNLEIKTVPIKLDRSQTKQTQSTDVMAQVKGDEKKVEAFFAEITEMAVNQFNLNPPSTDLLLLDDDKDS